MPKNPESYKIQGQSALNPACPQASWNISGLFNHDAMIIEFCQLLEEGLSCPAPIASVHGSPPLAWNAGRLANRTLKASEIEGIIQAYAERDIAVYFTFSNHLLGPEHLQDAACNFMLQLLVECGAKGGVILASDLLNSYLAENYPSLQRIASVVRVSMQEGAGKLAYYKEASQHFDRVVIHPDDNFNLELLAKLAGGPFEILVNEPCLYQCKTRCRHYNLIAQSGLDILNPQLQEEMAEFTEEVCPSIPFSKQIQNGQKRRNLCLSPVEIKAIYDLGFRQFKLQGRNYGPSTFAYELTQYLLEPEQAAGLIFRAL